MFVHDQQSRSDFEFLNFSDSFENTIEFNQLKIRLTELLQNAMLMV